MNPKVLLVEDCQMAQTLVKACLHSICDIKTVETLKDARSAMETGNFDLLILDVQLPDGSGFDFCERYVKQERASSTPVVFLTGETHITQKVRGFELDAADYITKPIEPKEFSARIATHLRKLGMPAHTNLPYLVRGEFRIDLSNHTATISPDVGSSRDLNLTPTEFKLLVHFIRNENKLISRDELRKAAWGNKVHVTSHTVDTHLSALRKKLGPESRYLQAVIRKGYRFTIESSPNDRVADVS